MVASCEVILRMRKNRCNVYLLRSTQHIFVIALWPKLICYSSKRVWVSLTTQKPPGEFSLNGRVFYANPLIN